MNVTISQFYSDRNLQSSYLCFLSSDFDFAVTKIVKEDNDFYTITFVVNIDNNVKEISMIVSSEFVVSLLETPNLITIVVDNDVEYVELFNSETNNVEVTII